MPRHVVLCLVAQRNVEFHGAPTVSTHASQSFPAYYSCFDEDDVKTLYAAFASEGKARGHRFTPEDFKTYKVYQSWDGRVKLCILLGEIPDFLCALHDHLHSQEAQSAGRTRLRQFKNSWRSVPPRWHGVSCVDAQEVFNLCRICRGEIRRDQSPLPANMRMWSERLATGGAAKF